MSRRHVVLVGLPGSGKSTVGREAARLLGAPFTDIDAVLIEQTGMAVADFFALRGEPEFRRLESAAMAVGVDLPRCDHRRPGRDGQAYRDAARALGGSCRWTPAARPSIGVIEAQRAIAVELCDDGTEVVPLTYDFPAAADHLVARILGRPATDDERARLASDMEACIADGGCATQDEAVRWSCTQLLTSVEFVTY